MWHTQSDLYGYHAGFADCGSNDSSRACACQSSRARFAVLFIGKDLLQVCRISPFEGDTPPEQVFAGVGVSRELDGTTVREIACTAPIIHDLSALENVLPCDTENALAMCPGE